MGRVDLHGALAKQARTASTVFQALADSLGIGGHPEAPDKENAPGASAVVFCQGAATITPGGTPAPLPSTLPLARLLCRLLSKQPPLLHRQPTRVATRCGQLQAPTTPRLLKMGLGPGPCSCPLQRHCIVMPQKEGP